MSFHYRPAKDAMGSATVGNLCPNQSGKLGSSNPIELNLYLWGTVENNEISPITAASDILTVEAYIQKTSSVAVMAIWAKKIGWKFGLKMA